MTEFSHLTNAELVEQYDAEMEGWAVSLKQMTAGTISLRDLDALDQDRAAYEEAMRSRGLQLGRFEDGEYIKPDREAA